MRVTIFGVFFNPVLRVDGPSDESTAFYLLFLLPKSSFGRGKIYAPQTKILEGLTKDEIHIFDILFNG
jgi:hypothetical protein